MGDDASVKKTGVLMIGSFTGAEIGEFLQLLRKIERTRPQETFEAFILDDAIGHRDALQKLQEVFPKLPDDNPVFAYLLRSTPP